MGEERESDIAEVKWPRTDPAIELTVRQCEGWLRARMIYGPYGVPRLYAMAEAAGFDAKTLDAAMPGARVERVRDASVGMGRVVEYFQASKGAY